MIRTRKEHEWMSWSNISQSFPWIFFSNHGGTASTREEIILILLRQWQLMMLNSIRQTRQQYNNYCSYLMLIEMVPKQLCHSFFFFVHVIPVLFDLRSLFFFVSTEEKEQGQYHDIPNSKSSSRRCRRLYQLDDGRTIFNRAQSNYSSCRTVSKY